MQFSQFAVEEKKKQENLSKLAEDTKQKKW